MKLSLAGMHTKEEAEKCVLGAPTAALGSPLWEYGQMTHSLHQ